MPFQVTTITTKNSPDDPDFLLWLSTQSSSILDPWPQYAGQDPVTVIQNFTDETVYNPVVGFVSTDVSVNEDTGVTTEVQIWESQDAYMKSFTNEMEGTTNYQINGNISCNTDSNIVTGTNTKFTDHVANSIVLSALTVGGDSVEIGTISSIESNTSLTLNSNAAYNIDNKRFNIIQPPTVKLALYEIYFNQYPTQTEITFANV